MKKIPYSLGSKLSIALVALAAMLFCNPAQAATKTFSAGTSWNVAGDWSPSGTPVAADALLFSTVVPAITTLDNNFTADTLSFNTASTMAIDANASLTTARSLTLNNTTTNANGTTDIISLLGGGTINLGVTSGKGVITLALVAAANNINVANGGSLVLGANSIISGTSKALSFTGNSTGMLTLAGANTFTGGFTLTSGIVRATTNAAALGAGTLSLGGGELQLANATGLNFARGTTVTGNTQITSDVLTSGNAGVTHTLGTLSIGAQTLTVAGGSNVSSGTAGVTFGATTLTGNAIFNVTNPSGGGTTLLTFSNAITGGTNTFTKTGNGTVIFSGTTNANTYTGLTTVSGGELDLSKTALTNAIAGNLTIGNGTVKLLVANQIADTSTVAITAGGTFALNALSETVAGITISSAGSTATLNLGNQVGSTALKITGATPSLTFGANTALVGAGSILPSTATNPFTLNFNGGQVSGGTVTIGALTSTVTATTLNITAGMGGGVLSVGSSGNGAGTSMAVNLNQTGSINVGSTILAYANGSGGNPTLLNVTIAPSATGMSGGSITPALITNAANPQASGPGDLYNGLQNTLAFTSGGSGFTLSGGVLDVRSSVATAGYGAITTNGNALTISGGTLLGNSLASTTGAITLSSGYLGLRNTAASTNFTVNAAGGSDGRTIKMVSGNTGTFTVASGTAGQKIIISAQSDGGTWDVGTVNAGSNYTITNSGGTSPFGSSFASYTIGANSGLNGVAMGTSAIPTLLTMGGNASFFAASSTAAARTYNVGVTGGSNDIVVAASGNFSFGIDNTGFAQIINLNRDKGADTVTLVSNGSLATNAVNIATNQTGAGNLYVMTKNLTLNSGVTFGGTGGILTDQNPGNGVSELPMSNFAGGISGAGSAVPIAFTVNGTLNGTNTVYLNGLDIGADSSITIGASGVIGGTQTWTTRGATANAVAFGNNLTNAANWTNGSVSYTHSVTSGTFETSTSSVNPTTASNYRFNSFNIIAGNSQVGAYKLVNSTQNDGGSLKEGFYATNFNFNVGDGSGGRVVFNMNGQDLYTDRFANIYGPSSAGLILQNDAANSVSDIRALGTTGDTVLLPGYQVLNGATLEIVGGNYNTLVSSRSIGFVACRRRSKSGIFAGAKVNDFQRV